MIDTLGDRMKGYEAVTDLTLPKRTPIIVRVDGRAFHTVTRELKFKFPFDLELRRIMAKVAMTLCKEIMNAKLAFLQSDEITILVVDYEEIDRSCWFDNRLQKMTSLAAAIATAAWNMDVDINNRWFPRTRKPVMFDAKVFTVPPNDVCNNFIWRQQDATRNSINALAQSLFSPKQLQGLNTTEVMDKMFKEKGVNWNDQLTRFKRGSCIVKKPVEIDAPNGKCIRNKWVEDTEIPIFSEDRNFINRFVPEFSGKL